MTPPATSYDSTLNVSSIEYTTNNTLQRIILSVVDGICSQDSRDRGGWVRVVVKRIALDSAYSEQVIKREIDRMLKAGRLYESCREIRDGVFTMIYVKNGAEILGADISTTEE